MKWKKKNVFTKIIINDTHTRNCKITLTNIEILLFNYLSNTIVRCLFTELRISVITFTSRSLYSNMMIDLLIYNKRNKYYAEKKN